MPIPYELAIYSATPFSIATIDNQTDVYVSDGMTTTYTLVNKTATQVGSQITAGSTFYLASLNQFTTDAVHNTFTLSTPPVIGTIIIVPGVSRINARSYDQPSVQGDLSPQVKNYGFYLAPTTTNQIQFYTYQANLTLAGIQLVLNDLDPSNGASPDWFNWAPSNADGTLNSSALVAGSTDLYTGPIEVEDTLTADVAYNATILPVTNGAQFASILGDYLVLDINTGYEEQVKLISQASNNLTITATAFPHSSGMSLFDFGRKFWLQTNTPTNASGGTPINFDNICFQITASAVNR